MKSSHYSQLFNGVTCDRHKNYTLDAVKLITNDYDTFNPGDINHSIASLCSNKACGIDVLSPSTCCMPVHKFTFCFLSVLMHSLFMGFCLIL